MQFENKVIPCLQSLCRVVKDQELTQEVRLTEEMPDIGTVLMCWGQVIVRGKEWQNGTMSLLGGVIAWVLYQPEGEQCPCSVETWIPFQTRWELPDVDQDGIIIVQPLLCSAEARNTSARKLTIRVKVSALGEALLPCEVPTYYPRDIPEDIQIKKNTYPVMLLREAGEKHFQLEETFSIPAGMPIPEKLLCHTAVPLVIEQKLMGDKMIFRGTVNLHLVYMDADGILRSWDLELPFSQYAQLDTEYEQQADPRVLPVITDLELQKNEDGSYHMKAGVSAQYRICQQQMIPLVEDAYSPHCEVKTTVEALRLPAILSQDTVMLQPEQKLNLHGIRVVDCVFYPEHPRIFAEGDQMKLQIQGRFRGLSYDAAGSLQSSEKRWEHTQLIPGDPSVKLEAAVCPEAKVTSVTSGDGVVPSVTLPVVITAIATEGLPMLTELEIGEPVQPGLEKPGLILRRAGDEDLWQIAKKVGSTVEAIQKANGLQQDPDPEQMLLIPII